MGRIARRFRRHQRWFTAADEVLKAMFAARGGGRVSNALAVFSAMGTAISALYPEDAYDVLDDLGLEEADLAIGGWACDLLLKGRP